MVWSRRSAGASVGCLLCFAAYLGYLLRNCLGRFESDVVRVFCFFLSLNGAVVAYVSFGHSSLITSHPVLVVVIERRRKGPMESWRADLLIIKIVNISLTISFTFSPSIIPNKHLLLCMHNRQASLILQ